MQYHILIDEKIRLRMLEAIRLLDEQKPTDDDDVMYIGACLETIPDEQEGNGSVIHGFCL